MIRCQGVFVYARGVAVDPEPIGLDVARTGRLLSRHFDDHLATAGGSLPPWLVVTSLMRGDHTMQREIASAIGIDAAMLTHHLTRMEGAGLVARRRTPENRRSVVVVAMLSDVLLWTRPPWSGEASSCAVARIAATRRRTSRSSIVAARPCAAREQATRSAVVGAGFIGRRPPGRDPLGTWDLAWSRRRAPPPAGPAGPRARPRTRADSGMCPLRQRLRYSVETSI
jgi:hypothetical protein